MNPEVSKLPPRLSDDDLTVIVQDWDESDPDQAVAVNLAREVISARAALSADREGEAVAVPRELLDALLKRDSVKRFNGECGCINHSRDAEREYEAGTCPHQRLHAILAASQKGEGSRD